MERDPFAPYTKEEQEAFRPIVQAKLDEARADLELLKAHILDNADEPTIEEQASGALRLDERKQLATRQERFIQHLEDAIKRIDNGTYGQCRVTGRRISEERLRLVPHAMLHVGRLTVTTG